MLKIKSKKIMLDDIMDANPAIMMLVDSNVCLEDCNLTALKMIKANKNVVIGKRGGEVLHCIHAFETKGGCGKTVFCKDCIIRNAVGKAVEGKKTIRKKERLELIYGETRKEMNVLVTAIPFEYENKHLVLVTLENINELVGLRKLIPICAKCKKVREDDDYWEGVDKYMSKHLEVDFTHGLCPDCSEAILSDHFKPKGKPH